MEELATLEALAMKTTAVMGGERVQSSGSQQKMADCVVKIADLKSQIADELDELLELKRAYEARAAKRFPLQPQLRRADKAVVREDETVFLV